MHACTFILDNMRLHEKEISILMVIVDIYWCVCVGVCVCVLVLIYITPTTYVLAWSPVLSSLQVRWFWSNCHVVDTPVLTYRVP